jgi:acyl-CoA reductase-like NAD-dependent aldehyde dehydrogenase
MTAVTAPTTTDPRRLDEAVARVREGAPRWARASLGERIALARSMLAGIGRNAERMVREACAAKGLAFDGPAAGEEWLSSPYPTVRILRQLARSLASLAKTGQTPIGRTGEAVDGRLTARVFPAGRLDAALFPLVRADVRFLEGVDARGMHERRAAFHKGRGHDGRVCLVLGAGNVNAIPPTDVATKLFNEGTACVLKMNPVNAYLGPILEDAFAEPIAKGWLAIVYGGAEEGAYLARHPGIDEIHVTGATATHDAIVWGPPGPERAARIDRGTPLLQKPITSELGDVAPVLVMPGAWSDRALAFQAESIAGMKAHNASHNCNAAQLVVVPRGWRQRDAFLGRLERALSAAPAKKAWYPGAAERYRRMVEGRPGVRASAAGPGQLPWALVPGLDAEADEPFFRTEAFCAVLGETAVGSEDPAEFLDAAVSFANARLWGMLSASIVAPAGALRDRTLHAAVERAAGRLRYGTVAVNCWPAYGFVFGTTPWGGYPGQPLHDVRSGRGFVHNTLMLDPDQIEKTVLWHPTVHPLKPAYFPSHRSTARMGRGLVELEARGRWSALPGIVAAAVRG